MRILYFTQLYYPALFGGGEYIFYQWAKELAKKGHQIFVITQRLENTVPYEIVNEIEIFRVGSPVKLSGTLPMGIASNLSFLVCSFFKGIDIIKKNKIDLIHSNTYIPVFAAHMCAKLTNKPHIVTMHDVYYSAKDNFWKSWSKQEKISNVSGILGPIIEKLIARLSVTFHTVSEQSKQDMQSSLGIKKKIIIIPNGIDLKQYDIQNKETENQVIFIGRLVFYKNVETILEAFAKVVQKIPNSTLVIVGDGPLKPSLEQKAESLKISNKIKFTGNIPDSEKIDLLSRSRVLLNPSLVEGFGIVVLEAFACRKPVLVSDTKPLSDLVTNSTDGFIIPSHDTDAWAGKIIQLLSNPELCDTMGKKGRIKASDYSISKLSDKMLELYHSLV